MNCLSCGAIFDSYLDLAKHISREKKGHRKGKRWAAGFLLKQRKLDQKRDLFGKTPLTEEQRESKRETRRELSGDTEKVKTYCPMCKQGYSAVLEVEHTQNSEAWRVKDRLVVMCQGCRS